jgi:hypothetical protein
MEVVRGIQPFFMNFTPLLRIQCAVTGHAASRTAIAAPFPKSSAINTPTSPARATLQAAPSSVRFG